jgi:hypothetical protein
MSDFFDMRWPRQPTGDLIEIEPATRQRQPTSALIDIAVANIPAVDPRTSRVVPGPSQRVSVQMLRSADDHLEDAANELFGSADDTESSSSEAREGPACADDLVPPVPPLVQTSSSSEALEDPFDMDDERLASQLHGLVSETKVAAPLATKSKTSPARKTVDLPLTAKTKMPAPVGYQRKVVALPAKAKSSSASSSSVVAVPAKPSSSSASPPAAKQSTSSSSSAPPVHRWPRNLRSDAPPVPPLPPVGAFPRNPMSRVPPVPPPVQTLSSSLHVEVGVPKPPAPPPAAKGSYGGMGGEGNYGGKGYGPGLYGGQGPQGGHHQSGGTHREYYQAFYKAKGRGKVREFIDEWGHPPSQGGQAFHPRWAGPYG